MITNRQEANKCLPTQCPKFDTCGAPICPLDENLAQRNYLKGEPACLYLAERSKPHLRAILRGPVGGIMYLAIDRAYPKIRTLYGPLKKRLERSANTGPQFGDGC